MSLFVTLVAAKFGNKYGRTTECTVCFVSQWQLQETSKSINRRLRACSLSARAAGVADTLFVFAFITRNKFLERSEVDKDVHGATSYSTSTDWIVQRRLQAKWVGARMDAPSGRHHAE